MTIVPRVPLPSKPNIKIAEQPVSLAFWSDRGWFE